MKVDKVSDEGAMTYARLLKRYCGQHRKGCDGCIFRRKDGRRFKSSCKLDNIPAGYNLTHCS